MSLRVALLVCVLGAALAPAGAAAVEDTATFVHEGDALTVHPRAGQAVTGETTLPAGSVLSVRMRSTGDTQPQFLRTAETTVTEYGTFEVRFDMSDGPTNGTFALSAYHDGERLGQAEGRIVPCDGDCTDATATERDSFEGETTLSPDRVGVVAVSEVTRTRTARIPVTFGDAENVTVVVGEESVNYQYAATLRDRDGDGRAILLFHTEHAGTDRTTASVLDADQRTAVDPIRESELPALVDPGNYPIAVYPGTNTTGDPADVGSLVVHEAPTVEPSPTETVTDAPTATAGTATAATATDVPETERPRTGTVTTGSDDGLFGGDAAGLVAVGFGVTLGVVGVGVLLGLFRS
ncbi:hypothetical protein SAMN04487947_2681 [Halogeometricum rufum]|uniref:DUF7827 domain-containing protein n=1 Tax=Halogeometricum rufum TaxID=553469 RepID=A0A1I6HZA8_9EURY|nr:BGTF surface domain-containing protein [Halogeometricum rufum]SFR59806.1 hypothetical protein SAMN04487947_2681 [Halogeometricum rufum]